MPRLSALSPRQLFQALLRGKRRRLPQRTAAPQKVDLLEDRILLSFSTVYTDADEGVTVEGYEWHKSPLISPEAAVALDGPAFAPFPESETFKLHSKPDSNYTLYLDFDGQVVTGTAWNTSTGKATIVNQPFDLDGNPGTFNSAEHDVIQRVWLIVAEDFAPFDVNVTTEEPPLSDLIKSGPNDPRYGIRNIWTVDDFLASGAGGIAYIGSFNWDTDTPTYTFNGGVNAMGLTFSHEIGHSLFLSHDGLAVGNQAYYGGHGSGPTRWGALMGAPFGAQVSQWDRGEYFDSNNNLASSNYGNGPDDLQVITTQNGFGYRADDHGSTSGSATDLNPNGETAIDILGIIERNTDVDYFRFETGAGPVSFDIRGPAENNNLDIWAGIYDSSGQLVAESNRFNDLTAGFTNLQLELGVYYLKIDGVGSHGVYNPATDTVDDPTTNAPWTVANPTGYSQYGSIGQYRITGTVQASRFDYGDAPDTYGTTRGAGGAQHLLIGATLGALRDYESDGRPNANADGDDQNGLDDEDGVQFLSLFAPNVNARIEVAAPAGGFLDAWIDWDQNGTFDPNEQIATNLVMTIGANQLSIQVPANALPGTTYARFRIADAADHVTGPTGRADSGEVEDYKIQIAPLQLINEVLLNPVGNDTGREYLELRGNPNATIPSGVYLIAVDGDGAAGTVEFTYNLGGLQYGANGYLTLLQSGNPYAGLVDPNSNVVVSDQVGWRSSSGRVTFLNPSVSDLDDSSTTFMLVYSPSLPRTGTDIDTNGDGTPDGGAFSQWTVLDAVAVTTKADSAGYAPLVFATNGTALAPASAQIVNISSQAAEYVGRQLESVGKAPGDWVGGSLNPNFAAPASRLAAVTPTTLANRPLDHLGSINFRQYEFGDAPTSYGTATAAHAPGGPTLGVRKDYESKANPSLIANGDDNSGDDDEDGVLIPSLKEGTAGNVSITINGVSGAAVVQGWFDWNKDGDFNDAGEQAVNVTVTKSGTIIVPVTAPQGSFDLTDGKTFARFRISSSGGLTPTGTAANGEIQDYTVVVLTSATDDFGDAPDSYGTTLVVNGARHTGTGPTLGLLRDIERNGQPTVNADGDNLHRDADEDGITFATAVTPGKRSTLVVNAPSGGVLDAWLDFNRNGKFDSGEQILTNVVLAAGKQTVNFDTPLNAQIGSSYARFRISQSAADVTSPIGPASNGEIEDYRVEILPIFNRPPEIADQQLTIVENSAAGAVVGTVKASDPDLGQSVRFRIVSGNSNGAFAINQTTGQVTVVNASAIDHEFIPEFRLKVRATDNGDPELSSEAVVRVVVTDVPDGLSFAIAEGSPQGTAVGRVPLSVLDSSQTLMYTINSGNKGGAFLIDAAGMIRVAIPAAVDFETTPIFTINVTAKTTSGPLQTENVTFEIKVIDRNERPTLLPQTFLLPPNPQVGTIVGTVKAVDPEGQPLDFAIFGGNEAGAFAIDPLDGRIRVVNPGAINFGESKKIDLKVLVRDAGEPQFIADAVVTIRPKVEIFFDNFETGVLRPNYRNATAGVSIGTSVTGDKDLRLIQTGVNPGTQSVILDVDITGRTAIEVAMTRTLLGADVTGSIELSNDGGLTWIGLNTFSGNAPGAVLGSPRPLVLQLSKAAEMQGIQLRGLIHLRFTANTQNQGSGIEIDNIKVCGAEAGPLGKDVVVFDKATGNWILGINDGTRFQQTGTSGWPAGNNWQFVTGDFNGDGRTDVAGFNSAREWWVGISQSESLVISKWADWSSDAGWQDFVAGDFNGDGKQDVAARNASGRWMIGRSNGSEFVAIEGPNLNATGWRRFLVGDYNGDGRADIAGEQAGGYWFITYGTPDGLYRPVSAGRWSGTAQWSNVLVGDFNGDRSSDIAGRNERGEWWIGLSSGGVFSFRMANRWDTSVVWQQVVVGDFDGDGRDDLLGRTSTGYLWLNRSLGSAMAVSSYGRLMASPQSIMLAGDFDGDGDYDLADFNQTTGQWSLVQTNTMIKGQNRLFGNWGTTLEPGHFDIASFG